MADREGLILTFSIDPENRWYEEFLYGVEEEGVPLIFIDTNEELLPLRSALEMATYSANEGCFDIGIGVDEDSLVVRHRLQRDDAPLLEIGKTAGPVDMRTMGHNAARIIKRQPLILDENGEVKA